MLLHRINLLVLQAYPQCLPRVKGVRNNPQFRCRACQRTQDGQYNGYYWMPPADWLQKISHNGRIIHDFCGHQCSRRGKPLR